MIVVDLIIIHKVPLIVVTWNTACHRFSGVRMLTGWRVFSPLGGYLSFVFDIHASNNTNVQLTSIGIHTYK